MPGLSAESCMQKWQGVLLWGSGWVDWSIFMDPRADFEVSRLSAWSSGIIPWVGLPQHLTQPRLSGIELALNRNIRTIMTNLLGIQTSNGYYS
jgi:hypothetical protein